MKTFKDFEKYIIEHIKQHENNNQSDITIFEVMINSILGNKYFQKHNRNLKFKTLQKLIYITPSIFLFINKDHKNYQQLKELYEFLMI